MRAKDGNSTLAMATASSTNGGRGTRDRTRERSICRIIIDSQIAGLGRRLTMLATKVWNNAVDAAFLRRSPENKLMIRKRESYLA